MGIDANDNIRNLNITAFHNKFRKTEIVTAKHGQEAPLTQNHGSYPINRLFSTRAIQNNQCRYLRGLDTI